MKSARQATRFPANQIADAALAVVGDIAVRIDELVKMGGGTAEINLLTANAATIQADALTAIGSAAGSFTSLALTSAGGQTSSIAALRVTAGAHEQRPGHHSGEAG